MKLFGVGKTSHLSSISNWTGSNDCIVVGDESPFSVWSDWGASQRDLFLLDHNQNIVFQGGVSGSIPSDFYSQVTSLIDSISDDCVCPGVYDPVCGADGNSYENSCFADCENVEYYLNGEVNNTNPCNPMECYMGEWLQIVIDCAEQMGVPCEGGLYVPPPDGVCCSTCVLFGDSNQDGTLNILDVVLLVDEILNPSQSTSIPLLDFNSDGTLNVLDVVGLVGVILNP